MAPAPPPCLAPGPRLTLAGSLSAELKEAFGDQEVTQLFASRYVCLDLRDLPEPLSGAAAGSFASAVAFLAHRVLLGALRPQASPPMWQDTLLDVLGSFSAEMSTSGVFLHIDNAEAIVGPSFSAFFPPPKVLKVEEGVPISTGSAMRYGMLNAPRVAEVQMFHIVLEPLWPSELRKACVETPMEDVGVTRHQSVAEALDIDFVACDHIFEFTGGLPLAVEQALALLWRYKLDKPQFRCSDTVLLRQVLERFVGPALVSAGSCLFVDKPPPLSAKLAICHCAVCSALGIPFDMSLGVRVKDDDGSLASVPFVYWADDLFVHIARGEPRDVCPALWPVAFLRAHLSCDRDFLPRLNVIPYWKPMAFDPAAVLEYPILRALGCLDSSATLEEPSQKGFMFGTVYPWLKETVLEDVPFSLPAPLQDLTPGEPRSFSTWAVRDERVSGLGRVKVEIDTFSTMMKSLGIERRRMRGVLTIVSPNLTEKLEALTGETGILYIGPGTHGINRRTGKLQALSKRQLEQLRQKQKQLESRKFADTLGKDSGGTSNADMPVPPSDEVGGVGGTGGSSSTDPAKAELIWVPSFMEVVVVGKVGLEQILGSAPVAAVLAASEGSVQLASRLEMVLTGAVHQEAKTPLLTMQPPSPGRPATAPIEGGSLDTGSFSEEQRAVTARVMS
eukprot:m51a1_g840 hypothetical protein (674) ;mRNA; f:761836-764496